MREAEATPRAETSARPEPGAASGGSERAADILRQIRMHLSPELRQASIQLEPAELGRIAIRLELRRGHVRAEVVAESGGTLAALERHAPELRAALGSAGFEGAELSLSLATEDDAHEAFEPPPQRGRAARPPAAHAPRPLTAALARSLARDGGVDTYA